MVEPHAQLKNGNVLKFVKDYWFLIVFLFAAAFAWSEMRAQVEANRLMNDDQNTKIEHNATALNVLDKQYIEDITFIKTTLNKMND